MMDRALATFSIIISCLTLALTSPVLIELWFGPKLDIRVCAYEESEGGPYRANILLKNTGRGLSKGINVGMGAPDGTVFTLFSPPGVSELSGDGPERQLSVSFLPPNDVISISTSLSTGSNDTVKVIHTAPYPEIYYAIDNANSYESEKVIYDVSDFSNHSEFVHNDWCQPDHPDHR